MKKLLLAALASVFATALAFAGPNIDANSVALEGHDPVAFFTDAKPVAGSPALTAVHEGAIYRFVSAEHRDLFVAAPAKYAPQYGGFCAFGVTKGAKFPVEIATWQVIDGRLFLNKNPDVRKLFNQDASAYIATADRKWPELAK